MAHSRELSTLNFIQKTTLLFTFLFAFGFMSDAQTIVTNETFPNQFNTSFGSSNNTNGSFTGSTGTWTCSFNGTNGTQLAAMAVIQAYYTPRSSYAIKVVNWNTIGKGAAECHAASPSVNLSSYACSPNLNLSFNLYTYTCNANDPNSFLKVEFSTDGGTNWASAWSMSSAQIYNTYGAEGYTNISIPITATYRVSGFKYRFSGYKPANQGNNFYVFVDDAKITASTCATCNGAITSLYFNKLDGGTDLPITNGAVFTQAQLGSLYNLEAGTSGTVGSVKFTITGPTASSNIENVVPYNSPGTGSGAWTGATGAYTVNLKVYSESDATGTLCNEKNYTFSVTNTCNPDDGTAGNGTSFCAPAPTCAGNNFLWSQAINNSTGAPSDVRLISSSTNSYTIPSSLYPAAFSSAVTVTVTEVVSYDGYAGRNSVTQTNERWRIVFKKNGATVASTPYTNDVPDLKNQAYWKGALGSAINLPNGTDQIILEHIDQNGNNGPGSVVPVSVCISYTTTTVGSIGDRVWFDANGDGIQNASETTGLAGVTVKLRNSANTVIATTTTNASGNYLFTGLVAGTYKVEFPTTLANSTLSPSKVGSNDAIDSDPSQSTGLTANITLAAGQNITTADAGYCPTTLSLGNRVWYDADNNGINNSEDGIPNIPVFLYKDDNNDNVADGPAIATLITDADGFYMFENLVPGNYIIGAIIPPGYMSSAIDGGDPDNDINLDDNGQVFVGNEVRGLAITLIAGTEPTDGGNSNITYDFGMHPDCSCTNSAGNLLTNASFESGTTGWSWSGGSLTTGTGYVACGTKNGFNNHSSGTSRVWQDVNVAAGATVTFSAFAGTHAPGISCSPKLSLIFLNASNAVIGQSDVTVTRVVGDYHDQLEYYSITAVAPAGTVKARVQSSITCNTMKLDAFCLTATVVGSIGDRVWNDTNKDGVQDANEVGLAGVTVTLYDNSGNVVATTVTDAYGNYLFSNLLTSAGGTNYQVRFSLVPGYQFSPNNGAVSVTNNSDANPLTGRTANITLTNAAPSVTYIDAGMYYTSPARLGDFVWNDLNKNGIQEAGEPGIAGVTVMLYTSANVLYRSTVTSNNGYYFFNDVAPGTYYVKVAPPIGYQVSPKDIGSDLLDSDIDPVTRQTANFVVVAGTNNLTIDAGLNVTSTTGASASLGDKVWEDLNNNNIQDPGEPGIPNVTVQLFNSANVLQATATTDAFGNYIFNGLTPGSYYIKTTLPAGFGYVTANVGANDNIDSDVDGTGTSQTVTLVADEINTTVDAGMRRTSAGASLGDYVWYDLDKDGIQDGGAEVGVPGITVVLYNSANAVVKTTTTDMNGFYLFTGLTASTAYTVGFENLPAGYTFSPNNGAVTVANNSDVTPATGRTGVVTTGAAGSTVSYVDAGLVNTPNTFDSKSTIGDKVWNDLNNNGIQDAGEPGIPGVTVTLYAADGITVIATTTTDALGNYLFTNINAGTYVVGFSTLPPGYVFATKDAGADDAKDSDANAGTGKTDPFTIGAGEINLTIDAGARNSNTALSSIGNFVWYDLNGNGIQNAGEPGVAGISVSLKNAGGTVIKTTTTSSTGEYLFTDLAAGTYFVQFGNLPAGAVATTKNAAGSTAANNSDANTATLTTDAIVLPAATTDLNWDMGIVSATRASLGDFVWNDLNANGRQDAGEPGVAGVTVTLYNSSNVAVASTITDANGFYFFPNVLPGTYSVGFSTIPASSSFTIQNAGVATAATNSDVDPATGKTATFALIGGQSKTDVDAGLVSYMAAVGDYVWNDLNRDGIQDVNETGVAGVTVTMYRSTNATIGDADDVAVASAVTDANGYYFINNVPVAAGGSQFYMRYTDVPTGYTSFTLPLVGGAGAADNSKVTTQAIADGRTGFFTLSPNQVYRDMDAGVFKQINLSGNVWHDVNGLDDFTVNNSGGGLAAPLPIPLYVYLINASTGLIEKVTTVSGLDGTYNFINITPNTLYYVLLSSFGVNPGNLPPSPELPSGWNHTGQNLGTDANSDGIPNDGRLTIPPATNNVINANFGIRTGGDDVVIG